MKNKISLKLNTVEESNKFVTLASFESSPSTANKPIAFDLDVTKQELDNLFETNKYGRKYLPEYYNPLEELIGELWTPATQEVALKLIIDKINTYIPRLVISSNTSFTYDNYKISMSLVFYDKYNVNKQLYNYNRTFDVVT